MENEKCFQDIIEKVIAFGAFKASVVKVSDIVTDRVFRSLCEANVCGKYGKCYTCPPDVGDIDELMQSLKGYSYALVYQTVGELEDSFDIEGMFEAGKKHSELVLKMVSAFGKPDGVLHLGGGGCRICEKCGKLTGEPCRDPEHAIASLEAYGVNVSKLAELAGMKYINGQNTVTYFGAMLFN